MALRKDFKLAHLLKATQLARSVFYYHRKAQQKNDRYAQEKSLITQIFHEHKGRYGYRRIMWALRRLGYWLNHKTVQKLMNQLGLKSIVRPKRYRSYRGSVGKIAPNVLKRDFSADKPNQKWVTDVTEFKVQGQRVYLSPIIDVFNQEVVSYQIKQSAHLPLVLDMLKSALKKLKPSERPILHSDQGWHYQMSQYRMMLEEQGLTQSMSRKGNCLDNAVAENFFGLLKTEFYHGRKFESVEEFVKELEAYITYYNHKRIKVKLKGLTPVEYRCQALLAA